MNKKLWGIVARDFNSPFLRNYIFTSSFLNYPKYIGIPVLMCGAVSRQDQIEYLYIPDNWAACHEAIKQKVIKNPPFLDRIIDLSNEWGEEMNRWSEKEIFKADLSKASDAKLVGLLQEFYRSQALGYTYGTSVALIDFAGFSFIDGNLQEFLRSRVSGKDFEKYYKLFTAPLKNSYGQDQEEDLLVLMKKYYPDKNWVRDARNKTVEYFKEAHPMFYSDLAKHAGKHAWVYYVYKGPAFKVEHFLEFIRDYLVKGVNPHQRLKQLSENKKKIIADRKKAIKKLKPNKFEAQIIEYAPKVIWAKPRRKDYQSRSYYHVERLMLEVSKRLAISLNQARCLTPVALRAALSKGSADTKTLNEMLKLHVCFTDNGKVKVLTGRTAQAFVKKIKYDSKSSRQVKELTGTSAFPGKVRGKVKIIYRPEDMSKMQRGDILVSNATTPSIVHAMKMSGAVVTDEGGLTCHAAIVSRELEIPCVIGTKIATQILKDGDVVEVDAGRGVIKKIK